MPGLTDQQLIKRLWHYGHFRSPNTVPNLHVHEKSELPAILTDPKARAAIASYQDFMGVDFEGLSLYHHGRSGVVDGDAGPATSDLVMAERCGQPDFPDPRAASGSGSWPMPCQKSGIGVSYEYRTQPSYLSNSWKRVRDEVFQAYWDVGVKVIEVEFDHPTDHEHIRVKWRGLSGSTIGLAEFNGRSCSDSVFHYLDPSFMRSDEDSLKELHLHEFGHNMNLQHVRQGSGVMSPAIRRNRTFDGWVPSDPSYRVLQRYFGDPIDEEPNRPPDKPVPGTPSVSGTITINGAEYHLVPKGGSAPRPRV